MEVFIATHYSSDSFLYRPLTDLKFLCGNLKRTYLQMSKNIFYNQDYWLCSEVLTSKWFLPCKLVASKLDITNVTIFILDILTKAYGTPSYYDIKTFHICWISSFCLMYYFWNFHSFWQAEFYDNAVSKIFLIYS